MTTHRCSALVDRRDVLSHSYNSSDPKYDHNDANILVPVHVTVVYDPLPPPEKVSSKFVDILNGIDVTFDSNTNRAELSGTFDCHHILNLTASPPLFLGSEPQCTWPELHLLRITFGSNPIIVPGDVLVLRDEKLQSYHDWSSLFSNNQTSIVVEPDKPTTPTITLNAPSAVGLCDDLFLDASASMGSGGRHMVYNYSVANGFPNISRG